MNNTIFSYFRFILYFVFILILSYIFIFGMPYMGCYWNDHYGILCPTCGISRSTIALLHFNITRAFSHHLLFSCILFPAFLFLILDDIYIIVKRMITKKEDFSFIEILLGGKL